MTRIRLSCVVDDCRHQIGSARPAARITEAQVIEIRERYAAGADGLALATEFGLAKCSIYLITSGSKWRHVAGPITRRRAIKNGK